MVCPDAEKAVGTGDAGGGSGDSRREPSISKPKTKRHKIRGELSFHCCILLTASIYFIFFSEILKFYFSFPADSTYVLIPLQYHAVTIITTTKLSE